MIWVQKTWDECLKSGDCLPYFAKICTLLRAILCPSFGAGVLTVMNLPVLHQSDSSRNPAIIGNQSSRYEQWRDLKNLVETRSGGEWSKRLDEAGLMGKLSSIFWKMDR